jgi:hypothetical protein
MTRLYTFATILLLLFCCTSVAVNAQTPDRAQMKDEMTLLRERLKEIEKQYIQPAPEDRAEFASFLQQPGTGIMRLLPREKFDGFLAMRGGGAYYSFTRLTNEYGFGSDIELQQDNLGSGFAGANFGVLTMLGDISLDEVKPDFPAIEYLLTFNTPLKEGDARAQARQAGRGYTINEIAYQSRLPVRVGNTYVLRSINYDESDVLVAFRVVRRDTDGSLIMVWKMLKKFPVPHLERSDVAGN